MSNYPPGAKNDPRAPYNQPDHSHEHRFRPTGKDLHPIIEDGAAIFHEQCEYAEGRYGEGWECEETRSYRFEYSHLEVIGGDVIDLPTIHNWMEVDAKVQEIVHKMEKELRSKDSKATLSVDPDKEDGEVSISHFGRTLYYQP